MERKIVLHTENLSIGYQNSAIINNINITVNQGELIGVIGINGAGKSTLLKTISQMETAISGQILLNQKPIESYDLKSRARQMGLVFANQNINKTLSIAEVIALGRHPYTNWIGKLTREDQKQIVNAAKLVDIAKPLTTKCSTLSDGQLQKVMIARVIAQQTPLIILDEPTTHLDMYHKIHTFKLLQDISKQKNKAIIFATHEINLSLQLCDKIVLIHNGLTHFGSPKELASSGILNQLFPSNMIKFDENQLLFKL
ncbi:ABC transporter ATP-binding protein [Psychroflexus sp. ALD_RP9]|uniref:ABC transporter ATP-binding protein n=1 Tax=Psychroflexus sp. ALD_RP9 TaxID=2777186 RepID=UPI001A8D0BEA|nr:ABC transporter ATP-binding protein [Psychroflexus sp. ALD_RP9]QSS96532.1 ABC transporter ATP-binding protein [Psychroflexus sp. ALD_RP9]